MDGAAQSCLRDRGFLVYEKGYCIGGMPRPLAPEPGARGRTHDGGNVARVGNGKQSEPHSGRLVPRQRCKGEQ